MRWFIKWIMALPKATLDFRRDYNLSRRCQKIENKLGCIAGAIYMYDKIVDPVKPMLISDLLNHVRDTDYVDPNPLFNEWLIDKGIKYGFIILNEPDEEVPVEEEAWKIWEMQE